jgi:hypothetical protein
MGFAHPHSFVGTARSRMYLETETWRRRWLGESRYGCLAQRCRFWSGGVHTHSRIHPKVVLSNRCDFQGHPTWCVRHTGSTLRTVGSRRSGRRRSRLGALSERCDQNELLLLGDLAQLGVPPHLRHQVVSPSEAQLGQEHQEEEIQEREAGAHRRGVQANHRQTGNVGDFAGRSRSS